MHLSSNAASTTLTFLVMLLVVFPAMFVIGNREVKKQKYEDPELFLRGENGRIEYVKSWFYFWDDIVPEVYQICRERYKHPISIYDVEFAEVGYELYGCEPAVEALNRAMEYMSSIGRTHHVSYSENERWFHHYRRPDLVYRPFIVTRKIYDQEFPNILEPGEDDRRRQYCLCSDGTTEVTLKEAHKPRRREVV